KDTKFSSPKTSSHNNFKFACSLSSMEIKITPSSDNKSLASCNLGYININQAECEAEPRFVRSKILCACSSPMLNFSVSSSIVKLKLSLYTKPSEPVLYGGSMYIHFTLPA